MKQAVKLVAGAADAFATICFAGFVLAILAQVAYRYLGVSLVFSEELARFLNVYVVFIGLIMITRIDGHIRVDIIDRLFQGKIAAKILRVMQLLMALIFLLIMTAGAWKLMLANWDYPLATMSWLSQGHIFLAPFVGGLLSAILTVLKLFEPEALHTESEI